MDYLLLKDALYLAQNRLEISYNVFQVMRLCYKKTLNIISCCCGINVLPLVWITWANTNMNINTVEPLVIEKLMYVLTVIVQTTAKSNNIHHEGVYHLILV